MVLFVRILADEKDLCMMFVSGFCDRKCYAQHLRLQNLKTHMGSYYVSPQI